MGTPRTNPGISEKIDPEDSVQQQEHAVLLNNVGRYTDGFRATDEMPSGHVNCSCHYTASAQSYQHTRIHSPIQLHRTHL